jgi:small subunit ribosomal protein S20
MPLTSSAKKANKRSIVLQKRNLTFKIAMKRAVKEVRKATVAWVSQEVLGGLLQKVYSVIDKASKRNIVHKNAAARLKSRLSKQALSPMPA